MPLPETRTPSLTEQLAAASSSAIAGNVLQDDELEFEPTLDPWSKDPTLPANMDPWQQSAPNMHVDTSSLFQPRRVVYSRGDERADRTADRRGTDPYNSNWEQLARSQIGSPYVWATVNPTGPSGGTGSGFDCSGFTKWVYQRAFGVTLPHLSSGQQQQLQNVSRRDLQPGDLVFYRYSDRNGPGDAADHVEIYLGNGQTIGSSGGGVMVRQVNWEAFVGGGRAPEGSTTSTSSRPRPQDGTDAAVAAASRTMAGIDGDPIIQGPAAAAHAAAQTAIRLRPEAVNTKSFGQGTRAEIEEQLYAGFMDAGAPRLARMVGTRAFSTWIAAESGWNVDSVSQYYAGHGRNYGLFQFWDGHAWTDEFYVNGNWTMSAYDQARMVVRYFDLTPEDIRRYAAQIRNDTYGGWG